jgi:hypothetical protein
MLACTEWTELSRKRAGASDEFLGIGLQSYEHVVTGQPAPGDDLGHRILQFVSTANRKRLWGQQLRPDKVPDAAVRRIGARVSAARSQRSR